MNIIIAVDEEWNIGHNGKLLADIPEDLQRFKKLTEDNIIIMGRKTYNSLPHKPLKNRLNIVLSSKIRDLPESVVSFTSIREMLEFFKFHRIDFYGDNPNVFVIGGGEIIRQFLPYCTRAYITKIHKTFESDTCIPNLDELEDWMLIDESIKFQSKNGFEFSYLLYEKRQ